MREFFRGWRRKAGLVTLAMACLLMAGWMRSFVIEDEIFIVFNNHSNYKLFSGCGGVACQRNFYLPEPDDAMQVSGWESMDLSDRASNQIEALLDDTYDDDSGWLWNRGWVFIGRGLELDNYGTTASWILFSYSLLVLPLTLISAWLLLIKPRPAKSAKESSRA